MRYVTVFALAGAMLLLTGCGDLLSLHALHTKQDQAFDPALEGRWENEDDILTITRSDDFYDVRLRPKRDPSATSQFEVHLIDIKGIRFADLLPADQIGHMIVRLRMPPGQLHLAFFDTEWLRQRVPHDNADIERFRKQAILTIDTPKLRALVARYANEPKAYDQEVNFTRLK